MGLKIDKCICSNITFSEVKKIAQLINAKDIIDLQEKIDVARNCRLCVPYLKEMLNSGETEFHKLILEKK